MEWTGCTHIPESHTSHSTHCSCLSIALRMPKKKMNLQKPAQPAQNLQPSHQAAPKLLLWIEAVLPVEGSFLLCCQTPLQPHRENLRQKPVGDPVVTFHDPARAVTEPKLQRAPWTGSLCSPPPTPAPRTHSSWGFTYWTFHGDTGCVQQVDLLTETNHLPLCCTNQSLQALRQRSRINIILPSALKHQLPISNNLKMPLSS